MGLEETRSTPWKCRMSAGDDFDSSNVNSEVSRYGRMKCETEATNDFRSSPGRACCCSWGSADRDPSIAVFELVKNAYDADAPEAT